MFIRDHDEGSVSMGSDKCPSCGVKYERLDQHWAMSAACSYPTIPDAIHKMLTGLLMGDGTVHEAKSAANPRIEIHNINHFSVVD